jgi:two-component system sensor histidine kinase PilS (NtrC family)
MSPVARPTFHGRDALSWFFLFRLLLVLALLVMVSLPAPSTWLPDLTDAHGVRLLLLVQAALVLASGLMSLLGWPQREQQVQLAIYLDLIAALLLIHLSGGVGAGFGLLPAVAVAWGALLLEGRQSLLFAALASLGVIAQQVYSELYLVTYRGSYLEAGLLGVTYFSVAALAHVLSRRLRESEQLAASQQLDIADLSTLSAYVIRELGIGVLVIDAERRIKLFNATAQRLLGGGHWRSGHTLRRAAPVLEPWLEQALVGEPGSNTLLRIRDQGIQVSLHLLGNQRSNGALIYLRDERDAMREAQDVNLASLGRLSASLAHNIRNPLAAVTHGSQLLAESPRLDADDQRLLTIVRRNARRLDEIVGSVLDLSNRRHLRQILTNLWDNARAHGCNRQGRCRINTELEASINNDTLLLRVSDSGAGVPNDRRQTIFEPFFTTSSHGTGLGLYAAKALAEANGARLEYSDRSHAGACFTLTFRITPPDG